MAQKDKQACYSRRDFLSTAIAAPALVAVLPRVAAATSEITVASPNGQVRFHLPHDQSQLRYRVSFKNREVIETSQMGIVVDGVDFGRGVTIGMVQPYKHPPELSDAWRTFRGSRSLSRRNIFRHACSE